MRLVLLIVLHLPDDKLYNLCKATELIAELDLKLSLLQTVGAYKNHSPLPQSPSAVILEPQKIKSATVSTVSPSICHEVMGLNAMILVF